MKKLLLILLLLPISGWGYGGTWDSYGADTSIIISDSLPLTCVSNHGYKLGSDINITNGNAITFSNVHNILFDLNGYDITYGGDNGSSYRGMYFVSLPYDITVSGHDISWIKNNGTYTIPGGGAEDQYSLYFSSAHDILFDSVNLEASARDGHCVAHTTEGAPLYHIYFRDGEHKNTCGFYTSRGAYDGAVDIWHLKYAYTGEDYVVEYDSVKFSDSYGQCIAIDGALNRAYIRVENCWAFSDARNYLYEFDSCGTPGDPCPTYSSSANAYFFLCRSLGHPSLIKNNYCSSGTERGGCSGILFENCLGASDDTIWAEGNRVVAGRGQFGEATGVYGLGHIFRIRAIDTQDQGYLGIRNNVLIGYADEDSSSHGYGRQCEGIFLSEQYSAETSHILLENNQVSVIAINPDSIPAWYYMRAFALAPLETAGINLTIRGNHWISSGAIMTQDQWESDCDSFLIIGDTFEFHSTKATGAYTIDGGCTGDGSPFITMAGNTLRDITFLNGTAADDIIYRDADAGHFGYTFQITADIIVNDTLENPIQNARVLIWDSTGDTSNYGSALIDDSTDVSGIISGIMDFYMDTDTADYDYRRFYVKAIKDDDSVAAYYWNNGDTTLMLTASQGEPPEEPAKYLLKGIKR